MQCHVTAVRDTIAPGAPLLNRTEEKEDDLMAQVFKIKPRVGCKNRDGMCCREWRESHSKTEAARRAEWRFGDEGAGREEGGAAAMCRQCGR